MEIEIEAQGRFSNFEKTNLADQRPERLEGPYKEASGRALDEGFKVRSSWLD